MERVVDIAEAAIKHMTHVIQSSDADETGNATLRLFPSLTVFVYKIKKKTIDSGNFLLINFFAFLCFF